MADEIKVSDLARDEIAYVVLERYRDACRFKDNHSPYQGLSVNQLLENAQNQISKVWGAAERAKLYTVFGADCDLKFNSITQEKVEAVTDWYYDLFVSQLDRVFTIKPSPKPTLDAKSVQRIKDQIKKELWQKMQKVGVSDPQLLMLPDGSPTPQLEAYLETQVAVLSAIEQNRIMATAVDAAKIAQVEMRDVLVEGDFRRAFTQYTHDRFLFGVGIIKFPDFQRKRRLKHVGQRAKPVFEVVPTFRRVCPFDFFPSPDATLNLQECLGYTERRLITKIDLVNLANQKNYDELAILEVLDRFSAAQTRSWLPPSWDMRRDWEEGAWGPDGQITLLIHEGYFTGDELAEFGVKGVKGTEYVSAHVEICGGKTIRCELLQTPGAPERTYFAAPYSSVGDGFWDTVGIAAKIADTERRYNVLMYTVMDNAAWSARPPRLVNPQAFDNPQDAIGISAGGEYKVNDTFGQTGRMPEPVRPMNAISSQFLALYNQAIAMKKLADDESGIPAYAYSSANYGQASLGEFAQRMTNALRTVKGAARREDEYFTSPAFSALFRWLVENNKDLAPGQDLQCQVTGMSGLLAESQEGKNLQAAIPIAAQGAQMGVVSQDVLKLTIRSALEELGIPMQQISPDDDPLINNAFDIAVSQSPGSAPAMPQGNQIPRLDGRSSAVSSTMAAPNGASQQIDGSMI